MRYARAAVIALGCAVGATVAGQEPLTVQPAGTFNSFVGPAMDVVGLDPQSMGPLVPGAPYSAEAVTEFTQVLADGNRIERRTTGKVARNGQGGVRREQGISFGPLAAQNSQPIVTIDDPANGVHMMLNYDTKVATRMKMMSSMIMSAPNSAEPAVIAFGTAGAANVAVKTGAAIAAAPADSLRLDATSSAGSVMSWAAASPAPVAGVRFDGDVKNETLQPQDIEGLRVEGTRTLVTLPAGSVGNVLPIEIVSERWYSPELKVVVLTRRSDPRLGETVYRLTNIDRSEPPPDLFKVPDGFTVEEIGPGLPKLLRKQQ
jgi:hypothetical protein